MSEQVIPLQSLVTLIANQKCYLQLGDGHCKEIVLSFWYDDGNIIFEYAPEKSEADKAE